jgi:hypothetical protein
MVPPGAMAAAMSRQAASLTQSLRSHPCCSEASGRVFKHDVLFGSGRRDRNRDHAADQEPPHHGFCSLIEPRASRGIDAPVTVGPSREPTVPEAIVSRSSAKVTCGCCLRQTETRRVGERRRGYWSHAGPDHIHMRGTGHIMVLKGHCWPIGR